MKCGRIEKLFPFYLEKTLSVKEKIKVEVHLKTCSRCAGVLENLKKISPLLTALPNVEVSPALRARLYSLPFQRVTPPPRQFRLLSFFLNPSLQAIMAASCIFLLFLSFFLFHPDGCYLGQSFKEQISLGFGRIEKTMAKVEGLPGYLFIVKKSLVDSLKNIVQTSLNQSEKR
ncbi:MAG: zf-HC2 domain-containing protein [Candidatus Aminicenantes bacterium]|nr:zf-HC2 domain-containing protein [Candidatus Aminicenantes bacterium]